MSRQAPGSAECKAAMHDRRWLPCRDMPTLAVCRSDRHERRYTVALANDIHTQDALRRLNPLPALARGFMALTKANALNRRVERLNALSDDELARRGLTREQAVRDLFRDRYYL